MHKSSRKSDPLLLTSREKLRNELCAVPQPQMGQDLARLADRIFAPPTRRNQRHGDILCGGEGREQVILLENKPQVLASKENPLARGKQAEPFSKEADRSRIRREQAGDYRYKCGFSAA